MRFVRTVLAVAAFVAAQAAFPQTTTTNKVLKNSSSSQEVAEAGSDSAIVVTGRRESLRKSVANTITETDQGQIARHERDLCVKVVGLPHEYATVATRMISANVVFAGRRVGPPGCDVNALAIFIEKPGDFLRALRKRDASFFDMTARGFDNFVRNARSAYSWQIVDAYGSRGQILRSLSTLTYQDPNTGAIITTPVQSGTKVAQDETGSRLTSGFREEIEVAFVAIDREKIVGRSLRQLADFATMHLMMSIKPSAGESNPTSILSLFENRTKDEPPPPRMTLLDRGILRGLYTQQFNNRSAAHQQQNIAKAIENGAGKK